MTLASASTVFAYLRAWANARFGRAYSLTRDIFPSAFTVASGTSIKLSGYTVAQYVAPHITLELIEEGFEAVYRSGGRG